jgi:methylated-DNA-protein-cysteine methyltransferase related protein
VAATGFTAAVWALARRVPAGRATTYGTLAEAYYGVAGAAPRMTRGARGVGQAMARCPGDVPWWRVVHADGADEQRARLAEEGVPLTADGRVDWARAGGPCAP